MRTRGFSMSAGVAGMLADANRHDSGFNYTLGGDLDQMSRQYDFLTSSTSIPVGKCGVYPALRSKEDYDKAIAEIYRNTVPGWWHYEDDLVANGVCTQEQYDAKIGRLSYFSKPNLRAWLAENGTKVEIAEPLAAAREGLVTLVLKSAEEDTTAILLHCNSKVAKEEGAEIYEVKQELVSAWLSGAL